MGSWANLTILGGSIPRNPLEDNGLPYPLVHTPLQIYYYSYPQLNSAPKAPLASTLLVYYPTFLCSVQV